MSKNIDIKLQIESINVARKELKKHFGELYELGALLDSIPLLEELEKLREGRNEIPIATITFSKKDLQKMVDEKIKDIKLDIQAIRNKAIDDFTEALIPRLTDAIYQKDVEGMRNLINDVAEQLKEGSADNE